MSTQNQIKGIPNKKLKIRLNRREFLFGVFREYQVAKKQQEANGIAYKLSELGLWPDEQLGQLIPIWLPDIHIVQKDSHICFRLEQSDEKFTRLFEAHSLEAEVFNLFNGDFTIDCITQWLCSQMAWEWEQAFEFVRNLFFHLVELRICVPK